MIVLAVPRQTVHLATGGLVHAGNRNSEWTK